MNVFGAACGRLGPSPLSVCGRGGGRLWSSLPLVVAELLVSLRFPLVILERSLS